VIRRLSPEHAERFSGRRSVEDPLGGVAIFLGPLDGPAFDSFLPDPTREALRILLLLARLFLGPGVSTEVWLYGEDPCVWGDIVRTHMYSTALIPGSNRRRKPHQRWEHIPYGVCARVEAGTYYAHASEAPERGDSNPE
jgi:hypothetical protein